MTDNRSPASDLVALPPDNRFSTILADPPWRFQNKTGKIAPEHRRLTRYGTLSFEEIKALPVPDVAADTAHLYLWIPNALLAEGLAVMQAWALPTNRTSSGTRSGRTAARTAAALASISET